MISGDSFLVLSLVGGLLTVEGTSVGQFMISRPLVAGTLTGLLLGTPAAGFGMGALLEVYLLVSFPTGGARFPEAAPATVAAVVASAPGTAGALAVALAMALVWGHVAGLSTTLLRIVNGRLAAPEEGRRTPSRVVAGHLTALLLDLVRGTVLTAAAIWTSRLAVARAGPAWPIDPAPTRGLLLLGGLVSVGVLIRSFGGLRRRVRVLGAGLAVGLVMGWLL
ncbi:MAG: PTS sugar transporter subunit IIC [Gemmatimonadota bacterium]